MAIIPAESSGSKARESGEINYEFCLTNYLFHTSKGSLTFRKMQLHGADFFNGHVLCYLLLY
jgi:hypothetical protein